MWGVKYDYLIPSRGHFFAPIFYERRSWARAYKRRLDGGKGKNNPRSKIVKVRRILQEL